MLVVLHAEKLRIAIVLQQAERIPAQIWDSRAKISRSRVRVPDLLNLWVACSSEGICDTCWIEELIEGTIFGRFLLFSFWVGQRSRNDSLLFLAVKVVLVQAFLLLLDKSFLKR